MAVEIADYASIPVLVLRLEWVIIVEGRTALTE
jgi:hypothetical protein